MKNSDGGSGDGRQAGSAVTRILPIRQRIIRLTPVGPSSVSGYVWRRVFLKGRTNGQ
ncbi:MAG: hypothetical protein HY922_09145 [Elusimicrobia bacterium]|nr:hypothetical protein [Elusimicrobiota bacterium]